MPEEPASAPVYRAPMRSRRVDVPEGAGVERALSARVCGFGGALDPPPENLEDALEKAVSQHDDRLARRIRRFADAPDGAFVWTRDADGLYWMGRLAGDWRYDSSEGAARVDLLHVRPCAWLTSPIADARVPSDVLATFARGGLNWQRTHSRSAELDSARVWQAVGDR
ncbi:GAF domain-containing protein [Demequina sp. SO4-18]|uniref:GAF domain-containing protein n=1 Tax=Demequina sp. SO4-18 TaxID=3401026 RepID=UPI003B59E417